MASLIGKVHNISRIGSVNITQVGERLANLTSSAKHNSTHPFKNFGQRLNSSRLLERFSSKHSLMSLASTGVSSNKTSTPKTTRDSPVNVTLTELKNSTESQNSTKSKNSKTIEKRTDVSSNKTSTPKTTRDSPVNVTLADLNNSTESQNNTKSKNGSKSIEKRDIQQKTHSNNETVKGTSLTSIIHSLPDLLSNATANVTTWAKKMMFGFNNITSAQNVTKKLSTRSVKLDLNSTSLNKTEKANPEDVEERRGSDSKSNSSLLNADVVTIKREAVNKTLNVSSVKHSKDSSKAKNSTHTEVKDKAANLTLNATMDGLNKTSLANVTVGNKSNGSLIKSSVEHHNHTKRSMNGNSFVGRLPNFVMGQSGMNVPSVSYVPAPPAPYVPAPVQSSYEMAPPAPVYGPTAAPAYSYTTPAYQMNPAAPVYPAAAPPVPAYRPAPVAPSAPFYKVSPAAPVYPQSESYYTAPPPTNAQYNQPMSYPAQPYGSAVPPRQSATESPWF